MYLISIGWLMLFVEYKIKVAIKSLYIGYKLSNSWFIKSNVVRVYLEWRKLIVLIVY